MSGQQKQGMYEELIVDDVLCWRTDGNPVYQKYTDEELTTLVLELRQFLRAYTGGF